MPTRPGPASSSPRRRPLRASAVRPAAPRAGHAPAPATPPDAWGPGEPGQGGPDRAPPRRPGAAGAGEAGRGRARRAPIGPPPRRRPPRPRAHPGCLPALRCPRSDAAPRLQLAKLIDQDQTCASPVLMPRGVGDGEAAALPVIGRHQAREGLKHAGGGPAAASAPDRPASPLPCAGLSIRAPARGQCRKQPRRPAAGPRAGPICRRPCFSVWWQKGSALRVSWTALRRAPWPCPWPPSQAAFPSSPGAV